jgi:hypothetical protein
MLDHNLDQTLDNIRLLVEHYYERHNIKTYRQHVDQTSELIDTRDLTPEQADTYLQNILDETYDNLMRQFDPGNEKCNPVTEKPCNGRCIPKDDTCV